jgi:hypothetical protein
MRTPGVMLHRLSGSLRSLLACGIVRPSGAGLYDIYVDPEEASGGGMVTISMHVAVATSPDQQLFAAWLAVPPGVGEGTVLLPSVRLPDMVGPVAFRVRLA